MYRLYKKYIEPYKDKYVFETTEEALQDLMVTPRRVFMTSAESLLSYPLYRCQIVFPWKSR